MFLALNLIPIKKQKFSDGIYIYIYIYIMRTIKQINVKNRTYYFYNDIIDLEDVDARLFKID